MSDDLDRESVAELLKSAGLPPTFRATPIRRGGNNRVYKLECGEGTFLLKRYFQHPDDPRDRLGNEFAFARFAWDRGVRTIPQPFACDRRRALGIYEFIEGWALEPEDVGDEEVGQALEFFVALNRHRGNPDAASLPDASEACFSLSDHVGCVERRIARLQQVTGDGLLEREARRLIDQRLTPAWDRTRGEVLQRAVDWRLPLESSLAADQRCLSPSDFGFHNALRTPQGDLRFFDFEYSGWDDPAKTVCDFLCQPAAPVPARLRETVKSGLIPHGADLVALQQRISLLRSAYRLKWCCIMLNEFLPVDGRRRAFAGADGAADYASRDARRERQLAKASNALDDLSSQE